MKKLLGSDISGNYTFNPTAKTITFSSLQQSLTLSNILLITNTTANTIIYNFADSTTGAVSFTNNVLTLDYNTTSMNSADVLQIYVDVPSYEESLHDLLRRMNKLLESNAVVDLQQRQRLTIDAIRNSATATVDLAGTLPVSGSVTVSGTVNATVSNQLASQYSPASALNPYSYTTQTIGNITEGPVHQFWRIANDAQACYSATIRSKLSFT